MMKLREEKRKHDGSELVACGKQKHKLCDNDVNACRDVIENRVKELSKKKKKRYKVTYNFATLKFTEP